MKCSAVFYHYTDTALGIMALGWQDRTFFPKLCKASFRVYDSSPVVLFPQPPNPWASCQMLLLSSCCHNTVSSNTLDKNVTKHANPFCKAEKKNPTLILKLSSRRMFSSFRSLWTTPFWNKEEKIQGGEHKKILAKLKVSWQGGLFIYISELISLS